MNKDSTIREYIAFHDHWAAEAIKKRRLALGISQPEIAKLLNTSRARIARIEEGTNSYTQGELDVISLFLEMDPRTIRAMSTEERWALDKAFTDGVTKDALGKLIVCELPNQTTIRISEDSSWPAFPGFVFSKDGLRLAGKLYRSDVPSEIFNTICVWNTETGKLLAALPQNCFINSMAFDPGGTLLAFESGNDSVSVFDWQKNEIIACLDPVDDGYPQELWKSADESDAGFGNISHLAWRPDGKLLVTYNEDHGTLRIWDTSTWTTKRVLVLPAILEALENMKYEMVTDHGYKDLTVDDMVYAQNGEFLLITKGGRTKTYYIDPLGDPSRNAIGFEWALGEIRTTFLAPLEKVDDHDRYLLFIAGDEGLFEILTMSRRSEDAGWWSSQYVRDRGRPGEIKQMALASDGAVYALINMKSGRENDHWSLTNLYSNKTIALPWEVYDLEDYRVTLAPNVSMAAICSNQSIIIQNFNLDILSSRVKYSQPWMEKLANDQDKDRKHFLESEATRAAWLKQYHLPNEDEVQEPSTEEGQREAEAFRSAIFKITDEMDSHPFHLVPSITSMDSLSQSIQWWKDDTPAVEGGYGLALVEENDNESIPAALLKISEFTQERVKLIDLATDKHKPIKLRQMMEMIVDRKLLTGEFTKEIVADIAGRRPFSMIWMDHAELLDYDTLRWLCSRLKELSDLFILIVRDVKAFDELISENGNNYRDWILGRAIDIDLGIISHFGEEQ